MPDTQPCKNCPDRHIGCHATCERYRAVRELHDKAIEARAQTRDIQNYKIDSAIKAEKIARKKRKGKR